MIIHSSSGLICLYHKKDNLYGGNIASGAMGILVVNSTLYGILFDTLEFHCDVSFNVMCRGCSTIVSL